MYVAYVCIKTNPGVERIIKSKLLELVFVREFYFLLGDCDFIARVEAETMKELTKNVKVIREMDGVLMTDSLFCTNKWR